MKRFRKAAILVLLLPAGCTSRHWMMRDSAATPPPGPDEAKVVFWRYGAYGGYMFTWRLYDGEEFAGVFENGARFELRCRPGAHFFHTVPRAGNAVQAELEGGRTYHVRLGVKYTGGVLLHPLARDSADEQAQVDKRFDSCGWRELDRERIAPANLEGDRAAVLESLEHFRSEGRSKVVLLKRDDGR